MTTPTPTPGDIRDASGGLGEGGSEETTRAADNRTLPVLSIRELVVDLATPSGVIRAVDGVSYDLHAGTTLGVVGESGSGKTVTVLAALGLLPPRQVHRISGSVLLDGKDLLRIPERERRGILGRDIAMVFQQPISALNPVHRVGDQIAEAIRLHSELGRRSARRRAVELLDLVGVPEPGVRADQYPHQFSGGMCQRAVIAMAIANQPKVLVADEPTTAVDVSIQAQLLELLRKAQEETGAATILISHDMGVVAENADRICVMYAGRIVESGDVVDVFARTRHPYTLGLLECIPRLDARREQLVDIPGRPPDPARLPTGCAFAPRCFLHGGRAVCIDDRPELTERTDGDRMGGSHSSACHFAAELPSARPAGTVADAPRRKIAAGLPRSAAPGSASSPREVLAVDGLVKHFPIRTGVFSRARRFVHAVENISFHISEGETLGLVGESGCGKSTTIRLILRLDEPDSGNVRFGDVDISGAGNRALREIRRQVPIVFQNPHASLNPRLTIGDNVAEPLRLAGTSRSERRRRARSLLEQVGLNASYANRLPAEFSGGQRQRVAIARALALQPRLLLLDEPTSSLDVSVQAQVLNLLARLKAEMGLAYLFVSHDLSVVRHVSDRVAVMYLGKIVEIGPSASVFDSPQHPYTQALLASIPTPDPRARGKPRRSLTGDPPSPASPPSGCRFRTRCPQAAEICAQAEPPLAAVDDSGSLVACHFAGAQMAPASSAVAGGGTR